MAQLALTLFGPFQARLDGVPIAGFESQKVRALLIYLALEADGPHPRETLAELLWPDQPGQNARTNLRQALANLRQALGDGRGTPPFVQVSGATIQFNRVSNYWIDVATFTALLAACDPHPHRHPDTCTSCARRMEQAAEIYQGDFLSGFFLADSPAFEEWALLTREQLHRHALTALIQLATYHERRGSYAQAQQYARRQLELEPWREESHRQLMRVLALSGERSAALLQYATCQRILAVELGVEPEEATTAQYERIRRGGTVATAGTVLPADNLATYTPLTPLIGRETELTQLADRLEQRDCRLLTLIGPGGIGKTRLALQAATDLRGSFPDGVVFVPLAALSAAELIAPAIASALGVTFHGRADPTSQLLAYLRAKELMLVLDNIEHLLGGADVLSDILQAAPKVALLVTSREPLHLRAEWLLDIQGLWVPERADASNAEQSSAIQLFVQTARRVQANFRLSPATLPSIVRICQLVAGTPLAIELAAAWVRSRSCREIAHGLEQSLEQLTTTMRDVPARHRSTRAVFEHSWRLLSEAEQGVLRRLSVFRGGMEAEAAIQVAGATLQLLAALVDKSLLRRTPAGRFDLHELVRQYAAERLEAAGEAVPTRNAHAADCLSLVEASESHLRGAAQRVWAQRLDVELDNLRSALAWTYEQGANEVAARLAVALCRYWGDAGRRYEGRTWLAAALARRDHLSDALVAKVLWATGELTENLAEQQTVFEESLRLFRAFGDAAGIAEVVGDLGGIAQTYGNYTQARAYYDEKLALCREHGDHSGEISSLTRLGYLASDEGDERQAGTLLQEARRLAREANNAHFIARTIVGLGIVAQRRGAPDEAAAYYAEALAQLRGLEQSGVMVLSLLNLAGLAFQRGDFAEATARYAECLRLVVQQDERKWIADCLVGFVQLATAHGQLARAARLSGAASALFDTLAVPAANAGRGSFKQMLTGWSAERDNAIFAAAWEEGRAIPLEQAIAEALQAAV